MHENLDFVHTYDSLADKNALVTPTGGREAININALGCDIPNSLHIECQAVAEAGSNKFTGFDNENPGALAGATGALDVREWLTWIDHNLKRESQTRDLSRAVANCEPDDRVPFLTVLLDRLMPGFADAFQVRLMREARLLVDSLAYRQRKALALAAYESLPEADQKSFVAHITGARNV